MTSTEKPPTAVKPKSDDGQSRLAEALRANLKRRKEQARARDQALENPTESVEKPQ